MNFPSKLLSTNQSKLLKKYDLRLLFLENAFVFFETFSLKYFVLLFLKLFVTAFLFRTLHHLNKIVFKFLFSCTISYVVETTFGDNIIYLKTFEIINIKVN